MEHQDLRWVDVDELLQQPPFPPRDSDQSIEFLTSSVRLHGVLVPILVRETGGGLQVVNGYRRLLAARDTELEKVPAVVAQIGEAEAIRCYLSDNTCRREILDDDRSLALERLAELRQAGEDASPDDQIAMAPRFGKSSRVGRRVVSREDQVESLLARTRELFDTVRRTRSFDPNRARSIVRDLLDIRESGGLLRRSEIYVGKSDGWLERHALWVASLNVELAPESFSDLGREGYALAGLIHDIGMVFLEDHFLIGAAPLESTDRRRLHTHTRIGYAIISSLGKDWAEIALAARDHHERLDGSGYPGGLRQHEMGRLARVTALTDSLASLLGRRPFREAESLADSIARLAKDTEAGLYDPTLFPLLHSAVDEIDFEPVVILEGHSADAWASRTPAIEIH